MQRNGENTMITAELEAMQQSLAELARVVGLGLGVEVREPESAEAAQGASQPEAPPPEAEDAGLAGIASPAPSSQPSGATTGAATYRITDPQDALDLVTEIKGQAKRSRATGGCYGVYRRDGDGRVILAIEIHALGVSRRRKRKGGRPCPD